MALSLIISRVWSFNEVVMEAKINLSLDDIRLLIADQYDQAEIFDFITRLAISGGDDLLDERLAKYFNARVEEVKE